MESVPDPTDFPPEMEARGLRRLDAAFSCQICGELYDAPMTLNCGHSFCSMCVRRSLRDRHECPSCRSPAEEIHLVKNVQLEDLCDSWRSARSTVLKLIEKVDELAKAAAQIDVDTRPNKKRKTGSRSSATPGPSNEHDLVEVIDDSDGEMANNDVVPSSDVEENEAQMQMDHVVPCPVCNKSIVGRYVNEHLDSGCKSFLAKSKNEQSNTKNAWSNILGNASPKPASRTREKKQQKSAHNNPEATERIPKPSYNVLKDKKIREMLAEYQLPTTGTREQLIARHTHFVLLFNANLDRAEHLRKSVTELRRDLKRWEDGQETKKASVDDTQAYVKNRNSEFRKHIEAARASLKEKAQTSSSRSNIPLGQLSINGDPTNSPTDVAQEASSERTIIPDSEEEEAT